MIIDAHTHIYPSFYLDYLKGLNEPPCVITREGVDRLVMYPDQREGPKVKGARITLEFYSLEAKLSYMDQYGITGSILSLGNPWLDFCSEPTGSILAARVNDELAAICAEKPGHFWAMACLPTSDIAATIIELQRIAEMDFIVGVLVSTRMGGKWIDDETATTFWSCIEELQLPVFLHPFHTPAGETLASFDDMLRFGLGFPFETTIAAARLIMSGTLDRFPEVKIILAHAGGALPDLIGRIEAYCSKGIKDSLHDPIHQYLNHFYFDAITYSSQALRMIVNLTGCDHLMFGTDHPYAAANPQQLGDILSQAGLNEKERAQVSWQTAFQLFNLS